MTDHTIETDSATNEEIRVPPELEEQMAATREAWLTEIEWERELHELQGLTDEQEELSREIFELFVEGLIGNLDDASDLLEKIDRLNDLMKQQQDRISEHYDSRGTTGPTKTGE